MSKDITQQSLDAQESASVSGDAAARAQPALDWEEVAYNLARRIAFVATHIPDHPSYSGLVLNMKDGTSQHWRDYLADGMELLPGVKVDRDMLHAQALPRSRRAKAIRELEAQRAKDAAAVASSTDALSTTQAPPSGPDAAVEEKPSDA